VITFTLARLRRLAVLLVLPLVAIAAFTSTSTPAAADNTYPVGTQAYVALNDTGFYNQPDYGSTIIAQLPHGATVEISEEPRTAEDGVAWYGVRVNGVFGWLPGDDLSHDVNALAAPAAPSAAAPPADSPAAPVRDGSSRGGVEAPPSAAQRVVDMGLSLKGHPYVWGGVGPRAFDCSGFVYYVFNKVGLSLPRAMVDQIRAGTRIAAADLQPGDLVFFQNTSKRGISHISIYIGNGKIVHAANERTGVLVSELWSAYWAAHYAGSVRVLR
jgi:cell wall-associated NlpC family hydrolase